MNFFFLLGYGTGIALGFYQGIILGECGPMLNINNEFGYFYQNYNLVRFLSCYLNYDIVKYGKFFHEKLVSIYISVRVFA